MKKALISLVVLGVLIQPAAGWCMGFDVIKTSDGGYLIAGATGLNFFRSYAWLVKIDANGNEVWNKTYKGDCRSQAWSVAEVKGGYIFGGVTGCENDDAWVVKVDEDGNKEWSRKLGFGGGGDSATAVVDYGEGALVAVTIAPCKDGCTNENVWLVAYSPNGTERWRKEIDFDTYDSIKKITKTSDGGFLAVGSTGERKNGSYKNLDVWILKLSENGSIVWNKTYDFGFLDIAWDAEETSDGFLIVGEVWATDLTQVENEWLDNYVYGVILKIDKNGELDYSSYRKLNFSPVVAAWSVENGIVAGTALNGTKDFIWLRYNDSYRRIDGNFQFLPLIFGPVKIVKAEDGFLILSNMKNSVWVGKFNSSFGLTWDKNFTGASWRMRSSKPAGINLLYGLLLIILAVFAAVVIVKKL